MNLDALKKGWPRFSKSVTYLDWRKKNLGTTAKPGPARKLEAKVNSLLAGQVPAEEILTNDFAGGLMDILDAFQPVIEIPSDNPYQDFVGVTSSRLSDFDLLETNGIQNLRVDNPSMTTIAIAKSKNITILPILTYTAWTDLRPSGAIDDHYFPTNPDEWAKRMVDAYVNSEPQLPPSVVEIWNEPWLSSFSRDGVDPARYLNLVIAFQKAAALKSWYPTILVAADTKGLNNGVSVEWRTPLLAADTTRILVGPQFMPTTHNYVENRKPDQVTSQPCVWDFDRYKCASKEFYGKKVWVTECGYRVPKDVPDHATRAAYLKQSIEMALSSGVVSKLFIYFLQQNHQPTEDGQYNLVSNVDNTPTEALTMLKELLA